MGRGRTFNAVSVILATLGFPTQARAFPPQRLDHLRRTLYIGPPIHGELSYLRAGVPGGHRLTLLHGTPGAGQAWYRYLLAPPPEMEVVAPDRPGFGASRPAGALTSLDAQAAAIAALLPPAGQRAIVLGHSMGGAVAARLAAGHPERVSALVLLAASLDPELEEIHPLQALASMWPVRSILPRALRNSNAELLVLKAELEKLAHVLPQVTAPLVIVHGTDDDLVPVANVRFMESRLCRVRSRRTMLLPGASHFLPSLAESAVRQAIDWASATAT